MTKFNCKFIKMISDIYWKVCFKGRKQRRKNNTKEEYKKGFVNDYLTKEEQEMFRKRAIPNGATWRGGILGYEPYDLVPCTVDRENQVYLFDLGTYHDALDLDLYNFQFVWDDVLGNIGVTFTMKYESIGEYVDGVGRDIIWKDFKLNLPYKLHSKRELIIDKIKEAMYTYGTTGRPGAPIPKYKIEFDF